ncbi:MAG: DUF5682 family protein, partial [Propionibacteriaceae bacterium]|nr:DUF5682 family protein [Propionibacteriaceae bacterium]
MEGVPVSRIQNLVTNVRQDVEPDARFTRAQALRVRLADEQGIWFAPIRHHSPACARGVQAMIEEVAPKAVLIEGPSQFDKLLPALTDAATVPPVAILSIAQAGDEGSTSYFFPLADFSPEWVGLRAAATRGIGIAFIDRPHEKSVDDDATKGLAGERYYAQSQALTALARREHCRDHDELWEHLFELPQTDWYTLFDGVFAWSALARLDYEPEVLVSEGSVPREQVMVAHIMAHRERATGPIVIITGAFHTLALVETLAARLLGEPVPTALQDGPSPRPNTPPAWLIRYDLGHLNSLTGYGAGIRSPGFYQRQWDDPGSDVTVPTLADIAHQANAANTTDRLSVAQVIEAGLHAQRLADLRGHPRPGRTDLLDACTSCFSQGDMAAAVREAIGQVFGGTRLGQVPPGTAAPPIVAEARSMAQKLRLSIDDAARRTVTLDVRRSPSARRRSRFFWLMSYLDVGFASHMAGPDYIAGRGLGRMNEEWAYAWTPLVEAALIGLIDKGATLGEVARRKLRDTEQASVGSSSVVAELVAQATLIGLDDETERLRVVLDQIIEQDPSL